MSLTSTNFMAAPGGFSTTLAVKLDKVDCSQVLSAVLKADKALLGHIKMGPVGTNIEVNWIEDGLNANNVLCKAAASTAVTFSGVSTASLKRIVRIGAIIQPEGGEYAVQLTASVTKLTLTCVAYGSSAFTAWTVTKGWVVGMPWADIDTASYDISMTRAKRKNFMQVFERAIEITQTRQNMDMEAVVNELQLQIQRRTMEIKRELDIAAIRGFGKASASNTKSGDSELRTMCGIIELIRDWDLDTTNEDTTVINTAGALTQGAINSLAYKIFSEGGLDEMADPIIVVGAKQARIIAAMEKELRRVEQGERQVGYYRNVFLTDLGVEMPVVIDRWFPDDKLCILDRSRVFLRPMKGDQWHLEKMAKTGRTDKWQLSGQYTLELRNADAAHGLLYNLT